MLDKQSFMTEHIPPSLAVYIALALTYAVFLIPDPAVVGPWVELISVFGKAVAPVGTLVTAIFAYYRWRADHRDKHADKKRIEQLERDARTFEAERANFRAEIRHLVQELGNNVEKR